MDRPLALIVSLLVLAGTLAAAVARPRWMPEWLAAAVGGLLLMAVGAISAHGAQRAVDDLGSTVGFLAALLVLAEGCRRQGVFDWLAGALQDGAGENPRRLFRLVFLAAAVVTVVLGLDATIVLLTPVVIAAVRRARSARRPALYTCAHLANSASLLLPVSNLTNLLAYRDTGVSFTRFAALMALPFVVSLAVEWVGLRAFFRRELSAPTDLEDAPAQPEAGRQAYPPRVRPPAGGPPPGARYALTVLILTLGGFAAGSALGIPTVWVAVAGAVVMALPSLRDAGFAPLAGFIRSAQPGFLVFVLGLGIIVQAASGHGLHAAAVAVLPGAGTLPDLLLITAVSAAAANLLNNLPATLLLLPVAGGLGLGPALAVLVGVNIGPNLFPTGSLATLLWRRQLGDTMTPQLREFTRLGLLTALPGLVLVTLAVWASVQVI